MWYKIREIVIGKVEVKSLSNNIITDNITILNYQGSKKKLLDFIYKESINYINEDKAILDVFSGTSSVGYLFKKSFQINC